MFTAILNILSGYLKTRPSWEQKKREQFYEVFREYEEEIAKQLHLQDGELVDELFDKLQGYVIYFGTEIQKPNT